MRFYLFILFCFSLLPIYSLQAATLFIIIDDLGNKKLDLEFARLPFDIGLSILPDTPYAKKVELLGNETKKTILIHLPMLGKQVSEKERSLHKYITQDSSEASIEAIVQEAFSQIPSAQALNNHQGSQATQSVQSMHFLMKQLKKYDLSFVDSLTTPKSLAWKIAKLHNIDYLKRDVFLDHKPEAVFMKERLIESIQIAKKHGQAIMIAHPNRKTLDFLQKWLPQLTHLNVQIKASSLFKHP